MPQKSQKRGFLVDVVPLTSLPLAGRQFFSYSFDRAVPVGSLVRVPLFHRSLRGIVVACRKISTVKPRFKLKPLESVMQEDFLTVEQLQLAHFLSTEYFTPLGRCLIHFAPPPTKRRKISEAAPSIALKTVTSTRSLRLTHAQKQALEKLVRMKKSGQGYLVGPPASGKTEIMLQALWQWLKHERGGQGLILVPEITLVPFMVHRALRYFAQKNIGVIHSHLSPGVYFETWERIRQGEVQVVIGTRQALFAPFKQLKALVVEEEQDEAYKQWDMSPRYDARAVAVVLALYHKALGVAVSATPRLETFVMSQTPPHTLINLPGRARETQYTLVNLRLERWKKNFSPLSRALVEEIGWRIKWGEQTLLFVNRQGTSNFSICVHCRTVLRCPLCERALVGSRAGHYYCLHCTYTTDTFPECRQCRGTQFRNFGIGTEKVEKAVRESFPRARIIRVDRQTMKKSKAWETLYSEAQAANADVIIGTQSVIQGWDLPRCSLVGMIDADSLLSFSDFRTDERAFQKMTTTAGRVSRFTAKERSGQVIIQTFHPENPLFEAVVEENMASWYRQLLQEREALQYPPFSRLVLLIHRNISASKLDREIEKVYTILLALDEVTRLFKVFPPHVPMIGKERGYFRKYILIRCLAQAPIPESLAAPLRELGSGWTVDVDPINII